MSKPISYNKKARFDYQILETFEGGLVLKGDEIKSIRAKRVNLTGSYVRIVTNEAWIINMNLNDAAEPTRTRKVLLHRSELSKLIGKTTEKGLTLVPLSIYIKRGKAKLEFGLGKGKKIFERKEDKKEKDIERDIKIELRGK
jgi:SsrA-binding protein